MSQPYAPSAPDGAKIPNNMVLAIIASVVSLFGCCIPWGVISLIFAMQVDKKQAAGDIAGAEKSAKTAKMIAWITIVLAILCLIANIVFGGLAFLMGAMGNR